METIEVKNLIKHFGKTKAVDGLSFSIKEGEIFGFLGPNGAGKTTTIRCLMDFIRPDSGEIKIFDKDAQKESVSLKEKIGYLSGDLRLYNNWTGKEHIDFLEKIRGKKSNAAKLANELNFDTKPKFKHLSTGNRRKLGLILALMFEAPLLVLDEPTVGLDPLLQGVVYKALSEYQKKGSTIFMSSHNLAEVDKICHRIGIIKEGKLVAIEDIQNLKNKRMHLATVRFEGKFNARDFIFDGVKVQEEIPEGLILDIKGDINPLIKKLANYQVKDLEITHASLEEIFLEFYEASSKAKSAETLVKADKRK